MRGALLLLIAVTASAIASPKAPDKKPEPAPPPPAAPRTPGPDDAKATQILDRIVAGPDTAARKKAIDELTAVAPHAVDALGDWMKREHKSDVEDRRKLLQAIGVEVPDKTGKFVQPPRDKTKEQKAADQIDWLPTLLAEDAATPGIGETIGDVAAIRALAATNDMHAAQLIFDAAFNADTMVERDECGRYLRKMEPASLPALTLESQGKDYDRKRYATFQLEKLDRQEPFKALQATTANEALTVALLEVFRKTHHREAVHAVWSKVDAEAPRIRETARETWMAYITGPPPPPAPKAKLNLPGGKQTKKPKPLWLTYRELADNELRKSANELLGENYPIVDPQLDDVEHEREVKKIDQVEVTKRLFAYFDEQRAKKEAAQWGAAKAKADAGDTKTAVAMVDRLLATNPERAERAQMGQLYAKWGKQLEGEQKWGDAAIAYSKAQGLDPKGASNDVLAAYHYTLGKSLEAQGKDGGPDIRRAMALKPDYAPAKAAAVETASETSRPFWMLGAAGAAAAIAALLFGIAMMKRRRHV